MKKLNSKKVLSRIYYIIVCRIIWCIGYIYLFIFYGFLDDNL